MVVIIKKLTDTFYIEHYPKVVLALVFLTFLTTTKTSDLDVIEITDTLPIKARHEVVKFIEHNIFMELLTSVVFFCNCHHP